MDVLCDGCVVACAVRWVCGGMCCVTTWVVFMVDVVVIVLCCVHG